MTNADAIAAIKQAQTDLAGARSVLPAVAADLTRALAALQAAPPPPPPPPPSAGVILFDAPFQTGKANGDYSPFQAVEWGGEGKPSPTVAERVQYDAAGLKVIVAPGDVYFSSTGERTMLRAEINPPANPLMPPNVVQGDDLWFGTTVTLDPSWSNPSHWSFLWELHQTGAYIQASVKLAAWGGADVELVRLDSGAPVVQHEFRGAGYSTSPAQVKWHLRASVNDDGLLDLWRRAPGGTWSLDVSWRGPTLPGGRGPAINYPLFGLYRGPSPGITSVLHLGHFRMATSEALIEGIYA